jgi:hypothetical protein
LTKSTYAAPTAACSGFRERSRFCPPPRHAEPYRALEPRHSGRNIEVLVHEPSTQLDLEDAERDPAGEFGVIVDPDRAAINGHLHDSADKADGPLARSLKAVGLPPGIVKRHFAEQKTREFGLLGKESIVMTEDEKQVLKARNIRADTGLAFLRHRFEVIVGDEEQQIALVLCINEYGPDADARTNSNLAGGGFIETLLDEKLAGRLPDALKFFELVLLALSRRWGKLKFHGAPFALIADADQRFDALGGRHGASFPRAPRRHFSTSRTVLDTLDERAQL